MWGTLKGERKCHSVAGSTMCQPKQVVGLGFRDIQCFNKALIMKLD